MSGLRALPLLLATSLLQAQAYRVGVDSRVELMSIIFRLAGNTEYTQCRVPAYDQAIDRHFAAWRDHPAVRLARALRETDGVGFDAVMKMAVHIKDVKTLAERVPFDSPELKLESRWHGIKARRFLEEARKFVADTDFAGFLRSQQPLYEATNTRLRAYVEKNVDLEWFNRFFGSHSKARFLIAPGLANGGSSYGASITPPDGIEEIYAIAGVWTVDTDGQPTFGGAWTPTLVHEFVHSYANPLIDLHATELREAGDRLFKSTEERMRRQAYGNGHTVLYESLVRACTARYILAHQGVEAAEKAVAQEKRNSFLWTGELFQLLGEYEKDRVQYPTLEPFMPRVVSFFNDVSKRVDQMVAKPAVHEESKRPKVLSMTIAEGAQDVDPALKEIVVRFDRAMQKNSMSVVRGGIAFPKVSWASYDETGTVFTMRVSLEPDKRYAFSLNDEGFDNFRSAEGVPLKPVPVRFRTRAAK
jgi:hypothetical protein